MAETTTDITPYNYAMNNPVLMIDPDGMAADTAKNGGTLAEVKIVGKKLLNAAVAIAVRTGVRVGAGWAIEAADPEPVTKTIGAVVMTGYTLYSLGVEINDQLIKKPIVLSYPIGTVLPTPTLNPKDFTRRKNGQGWVRNKTGEIYKKSHTSHGNKDNTGEQWKVWPKGTNEVIWGRI